MIRQICTMIFRATGWKFINNVPDDLRSFILVGAPHTSNYDFIPAMAVSHLMNRNTKFVIKSEWVRFPFSIFMKPMGAHGIDRSKLKEAGHKSNVEDMATLFRDFSELVLMIAAEGTRGPNDHWKTGFYHVALKAVVPIVLAYADYERKEAGLGKVLYPSDFENDMKLIMEFYQNVKGRIPSNFKLDSRYKEYLLK